MFAVIKTGGKQYRVSKDDKLVVEKLAGEVGDIVELGNVLMLGEEGQTPTVGSPVVAKAAVFAEVLEQKKDDKVIIFKKKRRQNYRRKNGHRQEITVLKVVGVSATGEKPAIEPKKAKAPKAEATGDEKPAKKAAAKKPAAKKAAAKKSAAKKSKE